MSKQNSKKDTILVTGAAGFIGRAVVAELIAQGYRARALLRNPQQALLFPQAETAVADITQSSNALREALQGIDTVIHLAGVVWGSGEQMQRTMVDGTINLIEAMRQADVPRLVLASSFSVYDWNVVADRLTESSPLVDAESIEQGVYAQAKIRQEAMARQLCTIHGISLTVLRPAAVVAAENYATADLGPRLGPVQLVIAPQRQLRLVSLAPLAAAFVEVCKTSIPHGTTINLVDSRRMTAWQFAKCIQGSNAFLLPIPQWVLMGMAHLIYPIAKLAGMAKFLPGLLIPARLACRFKSADYENALWRWLLPESAERLAKSTVV